MTFTAGKPKAFKSLLQRLFHNLTPQHINGYAVSICCNMFNVLLKKYKRMTENYLYHLVVLR
jgi:hypothetical protein